MKKTVPSKKLRPVKKAGKHSVVQHRFGRIRFLPALVIALIATVYAYQPQSMLSPARNVLAYATNVSPSGLLSATNTQRANNGVAALSSSSLLNSAAQAKANDMVNRNYWSHNTPDGQQPWVFITNAGYQYTSAGENLAYGFMTSNDTVTGWMNSPPHKTNLLGTGFTEVGFGIANSADYVGDGQQTVVVAMYAKPQSSTQATPAPAATKPSATTKPAAKPAQAPEPEPEAVPVATTEPAENEEVIVTAPLESETVADTTAAPARIERINLLYGGWLGTGAVILAICSAGLLWLIHKGLHLKRYLAAGEHFVIKHLHLDLTVLALIYLGTVLLSSSGIVR